MGNQADLAEVMGRLSEELQSTGVTQGDIASMIGVSRASVNAWLNAKAAAPIDRIAKLIIETGCDGQYVLTGQRAVVRVERASMTPAAAAAVRIINAAPAEAQIALLAAVTSAMHAYQEALVELRRTSE